MPTDCLFREKWTSSAIPKACAGKPPYRHALTTNGFFAVWLTWLAGAVHSCRLRARLESSSYVQAFSPSKLFEFRITRIRSTPVGYV
jgi:hypothetical protein